MLLSIIPDMRNCTPTIQNMLDIIVLKRKGLCLSDYSSITNGVTIE